MHPQLFHLLFADNAGDDVLAVGVSQLARLRRQVRGVTDVWRHIAKIFCRFNTGGNRQTVLNGALAAGQLATGWHVKDHFTQRATRLAFGGLQLIKAVEALFCGFDGLAHLPVRVAALNVQLRQEADGFHRTSIIQCINGFLNNLLVLALIKLTFFTTANQQNTLGQDVRNMVQQQGLPWFAFQFATAQQGADIAVADFIELLGDRGESAWFKDAHNDAGTPLFLRATAFYTELHALRS